MSQNVLYYFLFYNSHAEEEEPEITAPTFPDETG